MLWLLSRLPLRSLHAVGAGAGLVASFLPNRYREYTFYNLKYAFPGLNDRERNRLLRASLKEDGKGFAELARFWLADKSKTLALVQRTYGLEHLEQARAEGKGVILVSPHLGAWELLGLYVSTLGELLTLYRPPRDANHEAVIIQYRARFGAAQIPAGARGVRQLVKALKRNAMVGILPDQQPLGGQGVFAPFFGMPALTMTLLPRLAQRTGAPVIFAWAKRLPESKGFTVHFTPPWQVAPELSMEEAAAALNVRVAECVRDVPEQYQWSYKRYSERPPGEPQVYPKNRKLARREAREQRAKRKSKADR